jgi:hypothetical protein
MTGAVPLRDVVAALEREGRLSEAAAARAEALLATLAGAQPWYVRAMVGFGAWLASLLLIGFAAGLGFAVGGTAFAGAAAMALAVFVRRRFDNDFVVQAALAASLAGQALFAYGMAEMLPGETFELFCIVVILVSTALFAAMPDRIHRVLCILIASSAIAMLVYLWALHALVPMLGPLYAITLVVIEKQRAHITVLGYGQFVRPTQIGLMLSAFGMLLLSTVYLLPELRIEFTFYPRPWLSTLLLGALLLYVLHGIAPRLLSGARPFARPLVYGLAMLTIAAAWAAPGILLALVVVLLGVSAGNRAFAAAGVGFLAVFVGAYFYGIEITMLAKSITLISTGAALLIVRHALLTVLAPQAEAADG